MGRRVWAWLVEQYQWPYAAAFGAICLLSFAPVMALGLGAGMPFGLFLVYLQLPAYMVHQVEEHAGDRFRLYVNGSIAGGRDALTRPAAFWINSLGVWLPILFALYAGWWLSLEWTLLASYLLVINALIHIAGALAQRRYNPGLGSAVLLLLPLGLASIKRTAWPIAEHEVAHGIAAGLVVLLHVGIVLHVLQRKRELMTVR